MKAHEPPELRERCSVDEALDELARIDAAQDGGINRDRIAAARRDLERMRCAALAWRVFWRDDWSIYRMRGEVGWHVDGSRLLPGCHEIYDDHGVPAFTPEQRAAIRAAIRGGA